MTTRADEKFYVADVVCWLWNHSIFNMPIYTELEKAHLHSLLGVARINPGSSSNGDSAFDYNFVMCVIADYQRKERASYAQIVEILEGNSWDDYCRFDDDLEQLDMAYTGAQISSDPMIQSILGAKRVSE